jgi:hypothetical protein
MVRLLLHAGILCTVLIGLVVAGWMFGFALVTIVAFAVLVIWSLKKSHSWL